MTIQRIGEPRANEVPHTHPQGGAKRRGVGYAQGRRSALPWDAGTVWPADEVAQRGQAKAPYGQSGKASGE